ncbi:hypothetical protein BJ684DRAFT_19243 [Piptocephalis cylindrospora]|uniref:J domain-containing protein n=1 Tax=Piptocephalis cylindrospora TaxID=1907219 RepID=A0A4P9Y5M9_9FUNG|nr:hypothetical protein BJ684DRAFT_19243 [Piptocephalis cylindrospora]|eukprot:RKP14338.1 hypothetical protein BJ684DRAFT_19243 [Piptocephalis cylindrospora]
MPPAAQSPPDYYGLLGLAHEATQTEITKAYRKAALKAHPDKNPDDANASKKFHALSEAYGILSDEGARAAYDVIIRARVAKKRRVVELDQERQKLKEDLERREEEANRERRERQDAEKRLQEQLDRLRAQAFSQQQERWMKQQDAWKEEAVNSLDRTIKVKWSRSKAQDIGGEDGLCRVFERIGPVESVVMGKKGMSALVSFTTLPHAIKAMESDDPTLSGYVRVWAGAPPAPAAPTSTSTSGTSSTSTTPSLSIPESSILPSTSASSLSMEDYETLTILRMRHKAKERAAVRDK